ncbi:MAG: hypothetical protein HXY25_02380 [Alphaproteobacteria bacterium]|nr:hypothetical protein [Alphaproteobacteria bacterium]
MQRQNFVVGVIAAPRPGFTPQSDPEPAVWQYLRLADGTWNRINQVEHPVGPSMLMAETDAGPRALGNGTQLIHELSLVGHMMVYAEDGIIDISHMAAPGASAEQMQMAALLVALTYGPRQIDAHVLSAGMFAVMERKRQARFHFLPTAMVIIDKQKRDPRAPQGQPPGLTVSLADAVAGARFPQDTDLLAEARIDIRMTEGTPNSAFSYGEGEADGDVIRASLVRTLEGRLAGDAVLRHAR